MQLEDYFAFEKTDSYERIRVQGTRIDIEILLEAYLQGESPERIFYDYRHALGLEQVYATITYYLHNKSEIDAYLQRSREAEDRAYEEYLKQGPSDVRQKMLRLKAERDAQKASARDGG